MVFGHSFFKSNNNSSTSPNKDTTVFIIKEVHWRSLTIVRQTGQLFLCQPTDVQSTNNFNLHLKYEIIYKPACGKQIFSLCRMPVNGSSTEDHFEKAVDRFQVLSRISNSMFETGSSTNSYAITSSLQKMITTAVEHPSWRAAHIAAYNGYVDFFKANRLTSDEINSQRPPDLCTALHLAVLQGFSLTVEAILNHSQVDLLLVDCEANSVLHYAALSTLKVLEKVLKKVSGLSEVARSSLYLRNNRHWSPVELVVFNGRLDNLRMMMEVGLPVAALCLVAPPEKPFLTSEVSFLKSLSGKEAVFSKADFAQLDLESAPKLGGCPLHWARGSKIVEKLITKDGFLVDTPSLKDGDTALGVAVRAGKSKVALTLLYNNAQPNARKGVTSPMHVAIEAGDAHLLKMLLVFDGDVNSVDEEGVTLRHLAAGFVGAGASYKEMLDMLITIGARPCGPNETRPSKCTEGCTSPSFKTPESFETFYPLNYNPKHQILTEEILKEGDEVSNYQPVLMICFDGGGIKGLFTVQMMIELSKYLKPEVNFDSYFEWIGGTSTGAFIAIGLARGASLARLRKLYFTFKEEILTGKSKPYDEAKLEALFTAELDNLNGPRLSMADVFTLHRKHLIFTATLVDRMPPELVLFRSYPNSKPEVGENKFPSAEATSVVRALRASSAAPTFFRSSPPFIDGGVVCNNPTIDVLVEYYRYQKNYQKSNKQNPQSKLRLVLSFGNGQPRRQLVPSSLNAPNFDRMYCLQNLPSLVGNLRALGNLDSMVGQLKSILTNCNEHVVWRADSWTAATGTAYYRVNPVMSKKMALNETDERELISGLWEVKVYAKEKEEDLRRLAEVMDVLYRKKVKRSGS